MPPTPPQQSGRAQKMFKRLGMRPPIVVAPANLSTKQIRVLNDDEPLRSMENTRNWIQSLPDPAGPSGARVSNTFQKRSLPAVPVSNQRRTFIRAEITSPSPGRISCTLQVNGEVLNTSSHQTPRRSVARALFPSDEEEQVENSASSTPPVDPAVIRSLLETRDQILSERRAQMEQSESESDESVGSNYVPSAPSTDSEKEVAEDTNPDTRHEETHSQDEEDEGEGDVESTASPPRKKRNKVRVRQTTSSTRRKRQIARNRGESYVNSSGKVIPAKEAIALSACKMKCASKISSDDCSQICKEFWEAGELKFRTAYVSNLIEVKQKSSQKLRPHVSPSKRRNRQLTMKYHLVLRGENVDVCRGCFIKCLRVTPKFIELIVKKKMGSTAGIGQIEELRGRSSNGLSEERLECVRQHLDSFPRYRSHYARNKNDNEFLSNNLTMKIMFEEYLSKFPDQPVSRWTYEREFHAKNLKIKPLKIDTCNKCDTLDKEVLYARNEEEKRAAKLRQELHHRKAEKARNQKTADIEELKNDSTKRVVAFDLQQCLPTPFLQTSIVFYKRQLWVYNLTVHDCGSGKSIHFMWHEGEAERGSNEIGSALYQYLMSLPDDVKEVTLWSDTCGGQNKNSVICALLQTILHRKSTLRVINQKFLVSGHTFLDCDTDHSVIEGKKKKAENIHLPRDWYSLVRNASKKFSVTVMDQSKQLNFKYLLKGRDSPLVKRKKNTDGEKFVWKDVVWMQHNAANPSCVVAYKSTHDQDAPFQYLNIRRKKKGQLVLETPLTYDGPRAINQKKKDDLLELLHLIDPECRPFYENLRGDGDEYLIDPDIPPLTSEEESGEE